QVERARSASTETICRDINPKIGHIAYAIHMSDSFPRELQRIVPIPPANEQFPVFNFSPHNFTIDPYGLITDKEHLFNRCLRVPVDSRRLPTARIGKFFQPKSRDCTI